MCKPSWAYFSALNSYPQDIGI